MAINVFLFVYTFEIYEGPQFTFLRVIVHVRTAITFTDISINLVRRSPPLIVRRTGCLWRAAAPMCSTSTARC